eukprot:31545_1
MSLKKHHNNKANITRNMNKYVRNKKEKTGYYLVIKTETSGIKAIKNETLSNRNLGHSSAMVETVKSLAIHHIIVPQICNNVHNGCNAEMHGIKLRKCVYYVDSNHDIVD